jgi:MerR family transcriptional regulator/heat shock protein HspR
MSFGWSEHGPTLDEDAPVFVISVAAQLAGMHAQTLRQYDRLGLVIPTRTGGGDRRYSARDIALLREVQRLSQEEGVNLAGIKRIMQLENQVGHLRRQLERLSQDLDVALAAAQQSRRIFAAGVAGDVEAMPAGQRPRPTLAASEGALVVWRPHWQ